MVGDVVQPRSRRVAWRRMPPPPTGAACAGAATPPRPAARRSCAPRPAHWSVLGLVRIKTAFTLGPDNIVGVGQLELQLQNAALTSTAPERISRSRRTPFWRELDEHAEVLAIVDHLAAQGLERGFVGIQTLRESHVRKYYYLPAPDRQVFRRHATSRPRASPTRTAATSCPAEPARARSGATSRSPSAATTPTPPCSCPTCARRSRRSSPRGVSQHSHRWGEPHPGAHVDTKRAPDGSRT